MPKTYESLEPQGHFNFAKRVFQKIKGYIDNKVQTNVPANATFTDDKVTQTATDYTSGDFEVLLSGTADNITRTEGAKKTSFAKINPASQAVTFGSRPTNSTIGSYSYVMGFNNVASGQHSFAEGNNSAAVGNCSHSEGCDGEASGACSHNEGQVCIASGSMSHAEGLWTVANHRSQHVFGEFNIADDSSATIGQRGNYVEIVGNGTDLGSYRSNARTLDWNGNEVLSGKLTVGTAPTNNMDVATKQYVDTGLAGKQNTLTAGSNITIDANNEISATDTTYTAGTGINIDANNVISATGGGTITDVQVDGVSVVTSGVAEIDLTGKADAATTLSGYGITDANINNGTITLGSNTITPLTSHQDISGKVNKAGDTMTGRLVMVGTAASQPIQTRSIVGSNTDGTAQDTLHLQYGNTVDDSVAFGNTAGGSITDNGTKYSGASALMQVPRVVKSCNSIPGNNKLIVEEYTSGTSFNLPSNAWYHIYTSEGSDSKYACQLALGMTTDAAYYRKYSGSSWGSWHSLINTDTNTTYSLSNNGSSVRLTPSTGSAQDVNLSTLINGLSGGSTTPVDNDYFISQYVNGGTTTTSYHRRPISTLWTYIKGKADSTYQTKLSSSAGALSVTYNSTNAVTNNDMYYSKYGNIVQLCGSVKNKNAITIPSHGDIGDLHMFTLPSGYHPKITTGGFADNGNLVAWRIASDGKVYLTSVFRSTGTWAAGAVFGIRATFIV